MALDIVGMISAAKNINLTDEQKAAVKKAVKEASGNKAQIVEELKKHGINLTEAQVDGVVAMIDKL